MAVFSVVVPVHDEAASLRLNAPILLSGMPASAEIVFTCNGCTDKSADIVRKLHDPRVMVIELPQAGKAAAINAGERALSLFPRFYIDADVGRCQTNVAAGTDG